MFSYKVVAPWSGTKRVVVSGVIAFSSLASAVGVRVGLPRLAANIASETSDQKVIDEVKKNHGLDARVSFADHFKSRGMPHIASRKYERRIWQNLDHDVHFGYVPHPSAKNTSITILSDGVHGSAHPNSFIDMEQNPVIQNSHVMFLDLYGHSLFDDKTSGQVVTWGIKEKDDFVGAVQFALSRGMRRINILTKSMGASSAYLALPEILRLAKDNPKVQFKIILDSPYSSFGDSVATSTVTVARYVMVPASEWLIEDNYPDLKSVDLDIQSPLGQTNSKLVQALSGTGNVSVFFTRGDQDRVTGEGALHLYSALQKINESRQLKANIYYQVYPTDVKDHDGHTTRYADRSREFVRNMIAAFFGR